MSQPGLPLGDIYFNGQRFTGRRANGRALGEQVNLPLEGDQGATESYFVQEKDIPAIYAAVLGTTDDAGNIVTPKHFLFDKMYVVDVTFTPLAPTTSAIAENNGFNDLAAQFNSGGASGAAAFDLQAQLSSQISTAQYGLWRMDLKYQTDLGWEEDWSTSQNIAAVESLIPADSGQKAYPTKIPVPLSETNLTMYRRRIGSFDPPNVTATYGNKINSSAFTLPSGKVIPAECALFQTVKAKHHRNSFGGRGYGAPYWTVSAELLVKPQSWNKVPHRKTGNMVDWNLPSGTLQFPSPGGQADFNVLFANT